MSGFGVILGNYVRRALAYRWLVLIPAVLVFALVTLNASIQPDVYESFSILMPPIAKPTESGTSREQREVARTMFRSASERLLSTKTLTQVAEKLDPYPELRERGGTGAVIERLRENLRIEINSRAGTISVVAAHSAGDRPAEMAADIVNTLTTYFVKSQREAMEDRAAKGEQFLLQEKARVRRDLDRSRKAVEEFRAAHPGELPDDVELNLEVIDRLRQSIVDYQQNKRQYQFEANRLQRELARLETDLALAKEMGSGTEAAALAASESMLQSLELDLARVRLTYDEDNERVVNQKAYIGEVRKKIEGLRQEAHDGSAAERVEYIQFLMDEYRKQISRSLEEAAAIDAVCDGCREDLQAARTRIQTAAKLEIQYLSLKRDVADIEDRYKTIETRLSDAQYRRKYGEYDSTTPIQVEQRGFVPARPARPDRLVTSLIGLLVGLGIGVGLALTRWKLDASYQQADDLRALMPGAVLVTIPEVRTSGVRIGRAIAGVLGGLVLAGMFAATVAILGIQVGWWGEPEMIRALTNLR